MAYYYDDPDSVTVTLIPRGILDDLDRDAFLDLCERRCGLTVAAQAQAILSGRPCEEQNPNALEYVRCLARDSGETRLANVLGEYMDALQY